VQDRIPTAEFQQRIEIYANHYDRFRREGIKKDWFWF
jgi:hypothetical protein